MFETSILNLTPFNLHQRTIDTNIAGNIQSYWRRMLKVGDSFLRRHRISGWICSFVKLFKNVLYCEMSWQKKDNCVPSNDTI